MKKIFTKFIFLIITLLVCFGAFSGEVKAQSTTSTWYNQPFNEWVSKVNDSENPQEIFGERYTAAQVQWVIYSLQYFIMTGGDSTTADAIRCFSSKQTDTCATTVIDAIKQKRKDIGIPVDETTPGANTTTQSPIKTFLSVVGNNPLSGVRYISDQLKKFNLIPQAYAADGVGFQANSFIIVLWKMTRNLAFGFLTIAIIIMAFMIMFKVKISPQIVITVQSALPKIVIALILITFSYAIAGLLIDLMYVFMALIASLIAQGGILTGWTWNQMFAQFVNMDLFGVLMLYWLAFIITSLGHLFAGSIYGIIFFVLAILSIVVLLINSIKLIIMMLKTFVQIVLLTIVAPLQIFGGTIFPDMGFGKWLKAMMTNLMVYPVVAILFFLAFFFLRQVFSISPGLIGSVLPNNWMNAIFFFNPQGIVTGTTWDPPMTAGTGSGALGGAPLLFMALSFIILGLAAKADKIIQGFMAGKLEMEPMITEPIGQVAGYGKGYAKLNADILAGGQAPFPFNTTANRTRYSAWATKHQTSSELLQKFTELIGRAVGGRGGRSQ